MSEQRKTELPEVYALHQSGENWQISRRDFLKAAGIGAASAGIGMKGRSVRSASAETDLTDRCRKAVSWYEIITLMLSPDRKYLLSEGKNKAFRCWDFGTYELLAERDDLNLSDDSVMALGNIGGSPCLIFSRNNSRIHFRKLPELNKSSEKSVALTVGDPKDIKALASDRYGNIYVLREGARDNVIRLEPDEGMYTEISVYSCNKKKSDIPVGFFGFLEDDRKLLVRLDSGNLAVLDPSAGKIEKVGSVTCKYAAIIPGGQKALCLDSGGKAYRLVSLAYGSSEWELTAETLGADLTLAGAAATPDGSMGLLLGSNGGRALCLIDISDGSLIRKLELDQAGSAEQILVSSDGSRCAVSVDRSILIISLPDLTVIGSPVDMSVMCNEEMVAVVSRIDEVTGNTVRYSMPCGETIPSGAICICNCVEGHIHPTCTCHSFHMDYFGPPISQSDPTPTPHYWHPN